MPPWVKAFVVAGIFALVVVGLLLVLGSDHGPARHLPAGEGAAGQGTERHAWPVDRR